MAASSGSTTPRLPNLDLSSSSKYGPRKFGNSLPPASRSARPAQKSEPPPWLLQDNDTEEQDLHMIVEKLQQDVTELGFLKKQVAQHHIDIRDLSQNASKVPRPPPKTAVRGPVPSCRSSSRTPVLREKKEAQMARSDGFSARAGEALDNAAAKADEDQSSVELPIPAVMKRALDDALARLDELEGNLAKGFLPSCPSEEGAHSAKDKAEEAVRAVAELRLEMVTRTSQAQAQAEAFLASETNNGLRETQTLTAASGAVAKCDSVAARCETLNTKCADLETQVAGLQNRQCNLDSRAERLERRMVDDTSSRAADKAVLEERLAALESRAAAQGLADTTAIQRLQAREAAMEMQFEAQFVQLRQRQETVEADLGKGGKLAAIESRLTDLAEMLKPMRTETEQIKARVLAADNALLASTEGQSGLRTQVRDLCSRLDNERKRLEDTEASLRKDLQCVETHASAALQRMREANRAADERVFALDGRLMAMKQDWLNEFSNKIPDMNALIECNERLLAGLDEQCETLKKEATMASATTADHNVRLQGLEAQLKNSLDCTMKHGEISASETRFAGLDAQVSALRAMATQPHGGGRMDHLETAVSELRTAVAQCSENASMLNNDRMKKLDDRVQKLESVDLSQVELWKAGVQPDLLERVDGRLSKVEVSLESLNTMDGRMHELEKQLETVSTTERVAILQQLAGRVHRAISPFDGRLARVDAQIDALREWAVSNVRYQHMEEQMRCMKASTEVAEARRVAAQVAQDIRITQIEEKAARGGASHNTSSSNDPIAAVPEDLRNTLEELCASVKAAAVRGSEATSRLTQLAEQVNGLCGAVRSVTAVGEAAEDHGNRIESLDTRLSGLRAMVVQCVVMIATVAAVLADGKMSQLEERLVSLGDVGKVTATVLQEFHAMDKAEDTPVEKDTGHPQLGMLEGRLSQVEKQVEDLRPLTDGTGVDTNDLDRRLGELEGGLGVIQTMAQQCAHAVGAVAEAAGDGRLCQLEGRVDTLEERAQSLTEATAWTSKFGAELRDAVEQAGSILPQEVGDMFMHPTALPHPPEESVSLSQTDEVRRTRAEAGLRTRMVSLEERVQMLHKEVALLREGLHTAARVVPGDCLMSPSGTSSRPQSTSNARCSHTPL